GVGARGGDGAADPAEQVDLVADVEAQAVELRLLERGAAGRRVGLAAIAGGGRQAGGRPAAGAGLAQGRANLGEVIGGGLQLVVLGQGLGHQPVQHRVVVQPPPVGRWLCRAHRRGGRAQQRAKAGGRRPGLGRRRGGGAGGQQGGGAGGGQQAGHRLSPGAAGSGSYGSCGVGPKAVGSSRSFSGGLGNRAASRRHTT